MFQTFYSCSNKPESAYDNFTKQPPRNTLSTGWAIDGLASMFELTREQPFLRAAEEAADYAALYQAHFEPTFIDRPKVAYVFGGMRSQNTDAEWLDMRQAVISEGFMRLGEPALPTLRLCARLLAYSLALHVGRRDGIG